MQDTVYLARKELVRTLTDIRREVAVVNIGTHLRAHIVKLAKRRVDRLLDEFTGLLILDTGKVAQLTHDIRIFRLKIRRQLLQELLVVGDQPRFGRKLFRKNPGAVIGVNAANELINLGGGLGVRYASLLAPVW